MSKVIKDESYFSKIDTQNKAYILGYAFADGFVNHGRLGFHISTKDKKLLVKISQELFYGIDRTYDKEPKINVCVLNGRIVNDNGSSFLNICSVKLAADLYKLGCVPNKSLVLDVPDIPEELFHHFVRGYFDGDGCISERTKRQGAVRYTIDILSSEIFCNKLISYFQEKLDIPFKYQKKQTKINRICLSGNRQIKKFCDWMYKDATIYLDRKYKVYQGLLSNIERIDNKPKSSQYLGVFLNKRYNKWNSQYRIPNKTIHLGSYNTEEEAYQARLTFIKENSANLESHAYSELNRPQR